MSPLCDTRLSSLNIVNSSHGNAVVMASRFLVSVFTGGIFTDKNYVTNDGKIKNAQTITAAVSYSIHHGISSHSIFPSSACLIKYTVTRSSFVIDLKTL
jgi:hypothetical protein